MGDDVLLLRGFSATEALSQTFEFNLDVISAERAIKFEDIVGQNVTIRLNLPDEETRYFNGFISRFEQAAPDPEASFFEYRATMVPWLWFLTRTADCRIFQEKTVPDIIEAVFADLGFTDFEKRLSASYRKWGYCVQYRETDFNFISRLMEQEGIYYFFKHEDGKHTLVLCDSKSSHELFPGYDSIPFRPRADDSAFSRRIDEWTVEQEIQPGKYVHTDYNYLKPKASLLTSSEIARQHAQAGAEVFDYPGEFPEKGDGDQYAKVRMEELAGGFEICSGGGGARGVAVGHKFTLDSHPLTEQNREYLITATSIQASTGGYETSGGGEEEFSCSLTAIDATVQYRPSRKTPKPVVQGVQTAVVVGPKGEEIYTDKYGRIKVQFHWDRYGKADENSSCWIRVAQSWAGKKWGAVFMPRIGQEVMVEFVEGDPDHPIVTGRVYNDECQPPYLPDNPTISTVKSNSSKGGGGFNEIRFEDKKGEEQIFVHAEKNQDIRVKNDRFETILNNRHLDVKKDKFEHVANNRNEEVDADHMEKIGKDRHLQVVGKEAKEVGKSLSLTVKDDVIEVFKANHSEQTTADYYLKADNIVIEGMTNVTIKVGGSSIAIDSTGLKIKAPQIVLQGDTKMEAKAPMIDIKADAKATVSSPMTTVEGSGMMTVKGGVVMIN